MTIVFWTSVFAAKAIECKYSNRELTIFGFATGLATLIFMGSAVILFTLVKGTIPLLMIQILNMLVGCLLIGYGGIRFARVLKG